MRRAQGRRLDALTLPPPQPSEIVRSVVRILRSHTVRIVGLAALVFGTTAALQALVEVKVVDGGFSSEVEAVARVMTAVIGAFGLSSMPACSISSSERTIGGNPIRRYER